MIKGYHDSNGESTTDEQYYQGDFTIPMLPWLQYLGYNYQGKYLGYEGDTGAKSENEEDNNLNSLGEFFQNIFT